MKMLGLDVGERRTGVSFFDEAIGFVIPLDTIEHKRDEELIERVSAILVARNVKDIVVGLPLLLSGVVGSQARFSKEIGAKLQALGNTISYIDERFTTDRMSPGDGDAKAAVIVLNTYLEQRVPRGVDKPEK